MKHTVEEIETETINKIANQVNAFGKKIKRGTTNSNQFISINEIENNWRQLKSETDKEYSKMVGEMIEAIDERDIVRKKKRVQRAWNKAKNEPSGKANAHNLAGRSTLYT